ncbi:MAG: 50S ribosomal protein L1 [Verrucomicrobiota bacterium]
MATATRSKRYRKAAELAPETESLGLKDAVAVLQGLPKTAFDETVELQARLYVDPKQSTQMVRGTVSLPHGSGKTVRVIAFTDNVEDAKKAGADEAGLTDLIEKVQEGWMDFDVAVATTAAMKEVRKVARVLGPRGLMPNPKAGTVSDNLSEAVQAVKAGRVEFKMDKTANVAIVIGKRSFTADQVEENALAAIEVLGKARPETLRGKFIKSLTLSSTMSPGIALSPSTYDKF